MSGETCAIRTQNPETGCQWETPGRLMHSGDSCKESPLLYSCWLFAVIANRLLNPMRTVLHRRHVHWPGAYSPGLFHHYSHGRCCVHVFLIRYRLSSRDVLMSSDHGVRTLPLRYPFARSALFPPFEISSREH